MRRFGDPPPDEDPEMEDALRHMGARVRELRKQAGMTQGQLGIIIGVNQSFVAAIEHGSARLSMYALWRIARTFNVLPDQLLPLSGAPPMTELPTLVAAMDRVSAIQQQLKQMREAWEEHGRQLTDTDEMLVGLRRELQWWVKWASPSTSGTVKKEKK